MTVVLFLALALTNGFWFNGKHWRVRVTHAITKHGNLLGETDCEKREVWLLPAPVKEMRQTFRHELVHVFTNCTVLDAQDDIDTFADRVADGYEALVGDQRNRAVIDWLDAPRGVGK